MTDILPKVGLTLMAVALAGGMASLLVVASRQGLPKWGLLLAATGMLGWLLFGVNLIASLWL